MTDDELRELEDPESWDYESAEKHQGTKSVRVVVSVAFHREDFARVSEGAERVGKKTSEYIREAALEKTVHEDELARVASFSGSLGASVYTREPLTVTRVSVPRVSTNVRESGVARNEEALTA